jgi:hypothetical protein
VVEIVQKPIKPDQPDKWARIPLPTNTPAWVHADFIDATNKTVKPRRLNVRSGPSEEHTVIGAITKGTPVKDVETKGEWVRIEPPQGLYAFVAAHLLAPAAPAVEIAKASTVKPEGIQPPTPTVETPVAAPVPVPPATEPKTETPAGTPPADAATTRPETTPLGPQATPDEEIKRVVSREGIVKRSVSIQAPTWFVLESPATRKTINYLFIPTTNHVALRDYFGQRVIVTGEEGLDERWPNTPVINVESIEVIP